ncbi:MAG TPA: hypothetical protein V6C97_31015 [Oculatellaceae cyanobacterium]
MQEKSNWSKSRMLRHTALGTAVSIALQLTCSYAIAYADTNSDGVDDSRLASVSGVGLNAPSLPKADETRQDIASATTIHQDLDTASKIAAVVAPAVQESPVETTSVVDPNATRNGNMSLAAAAGLAPASTTTTTTTTSTTTTSTSGNTSITSPSSLLSGVVVTETDDPMERVNRDLIIKMFELERLNTYFRIESTKQSKWRKWRTLISEETAAISVAAGTLIAIEQSLRSLHTGYKFHVLKLGPTLVFAKYFRPPGNIVLEHAYVTALPGVWFAVFQECFELGQNYFSDWKARQKGFDPTTTRLKAKEIQDQIDGLLAQRDGLVAASTASAPEKELLSAEGKVLHDMRDITVQEYKNYYVGARKIRCYQNMFYLADIAEKVTGVMSLQAGLEAVRRNKIKFNEAFGTLQATSAFLVILTPIMAKLYSNWRGKGAQRTVDETIHANAAVTAETFDADRKHLQDLYLANGSSRGQTMLNNLIARDAVYRMENENFYALQAMAAREKRDEHQAFINALKIRSVAFVGKMAYAVNVGFILGDGRQTAPRKITELIVAGTIPYEVVLDASIYDKAHTAIKGYKYENQLRSKNELPGQIYRARLERMDQAQGILAPKKL